MKIKKIFKIPFILLFSLLFLLLTKVKFGPILGTKMGFSFSVFLGPTFGKIFGIGWGTGVIVLTHLTGIALGLYKLETIKNIFTFLPIIFAGIYFSKIFKGEKKLIFLPALCILFFILHPIGRTVWFYSGFWLIPISISLFKEKLDKLFRLPVFKIYGYSLGSAFVDHAMGSVIYLYLLNIPAHFWIQAVPLTIIERLMIAGGISFCYSAQLLFIKVFQKASVFAKLRKLVFARV